MWMPSGVNGSREDRNGREGGEKNRVDNKGEVADGGRPAAALLSTDAGEDGMVAGGGWGRALATGRIAPRMIKRGAW